MIQPYFISETEDTPEIKLDAAQGTFYIKGISLPENAPNFYLPVIDWLKKYLAGPNPETVFVFNLKYFNSSSSKQLFSILQLLKSLETYGKKIEIQWEYIEGDEMMEEEAQEFVALLKFPISLVPIKE